MTGNWFSVLTALMDKQIFNELTKNVSIGREHPDYFIYDEEVCHLKCNCFPSKEEDFCLVSVESNEDGQPYVYARLLDTDHNNITMLVKKEITL